MIGPGSVVGIATGYGLDGPGIESRWVRDFPHPVQTGPGAHPASCTMGTGSFPGVNSSPGMTLNPHSLLVSWLWKGSAIPLLPLWAIRPAQNLSACTRVTFTFTFTICIIGVKGIGLQVLAGVFQLFFVGGGGEYPSLYNSKHSSSLPPSYFTALTLTRWSGKFLLNIEKCFTSKCKNTKNEHSMNVTKEFF